MVTTVTLSLFLSDSSFGIASVGAILAVVTVAPVVHRGTSRGRRCGSSRALFRFGDLVPLVRPVRAVATVVPVVAIVSVADRCFSGCGGSRRGGRGAAVVSLLEVVRPIGAILSVLAVVAVVAIVDRSLGRGFGRRSRGGRLSIFAVTLRDIISLVCAVGSVVAVLAIVSIVAILSNPGRGRGLADLRGGGTRDWSSAHSQELSAQSEQEGLASKVHLEECLTLTIAKEMSGSEC